MTPEKQRICIAEACGWTFVRQLPSGDRWTVGLPPDKTKIHPDDNVPDYLNDLNAMHEAEKVLAQNPEDIEYCDGLYADYGENLCAVCGYDQHERVWFSYPVYHATAAQRAEAFLRTIGKWEEE